jgi:hypothetical protein
MPIAARKPFVVKCEAFEEEMNTTGHANPRQRDRRLYIALSLSLIGVVFVGFARTYYLSAFFTERTRVLTWLLHLHGAVFSAWFVLLLVQVVLVARGRTDLHRRVGVAGAALACIMVPLGLTVAIHAEKYGSFGTPSSGIAFARLAVPFFDMVVFGSLAASGLLNRQRPQIHKRFMVLSAFSILTPAVVRIPLHLIQNHGFFPPYVIADLFLFLYIGYDTILHKRLHPVCLWGGLLIVLSAPARFLIGGTGAWMMFARWLTHL